MRNIKQNNWPAFLKNVKIGKNKERQRKIPFLRKLEILAATCNV